MRSSLRAPALHIDCIAASMNEIIVEAILHERAVILAPKKASQVGFIVGKKHRWNLARRIGTDFAQESSQDIVRRALGVFGKNIEVPVAFKYSCIDKFKLRRISSPAPVLRDQSAVRKL